MTSTEQLNFSLDRYMVTTKRIDNLVCLSRVDKVFFSGQMCRFDVSRIDGVSEIILNFNIFFAILETFLFIICPKETNGIKNNNRSSFLIISNF
jgi:hypothetical protein